MSDRDEITVIIDRMLSEKCAFALGDNWPYEVAEAIVNAGFRKTRLVVTVEALDALPLESVILSEQGGVWERQLGTLGTPLWVEPFQGHGFPHTSDEISLPATVLHTPEETV